MILDKIMSRFNRILHNNAVSKKHREWNIFRPYTYRGMVNRTLKIADFASNQYTIKYVNGSLQKTPKRRKKNNCNG
jgi:hypothetical protein